MAVDADRVRGDPRGDPADGFGGFGRVLREVGDDLAVGDLPTGSGADDLDVQLRAPLDQPPVQLIWVRCGHASGAGDGAAQGVLELAGGQMRWRAATVGNVEADECVEVDQAAGLELGDLPEAGLDPDAAAGAVEFAVEGLGGAPPQFSGMDVPDDD